MTQAHRAASIFISHTHSDEKLADAVRDAMHTLFGGKADVRYSTSKELEGGIRPGEDWFRWINVQVREAQIAFILLTPASIQKPWILWEAGAVSGAALASGDTGHHKLRPVSYRLTDSDIPTPFAREQITDGLNRAEVEMLFSDVLSSLGAELHHSVLITGGKNLTKACDDYLRAAEEAMRLAPLLVTEAAVQEWIGRIDNLAAENRESEIGELHDWLNLAFGHDSAEIDAPPETPMPRRPLDVRIHRRLGELYGKAGVPVKASREFELARYLAPRDLFILRRLGKAYLDQALWDAAGAVIAEIEDLDPKAFLRNAENAALKARWLRDKGSPAEALKALESAWAEKQTSYYLGDLLGQAQLAAGKRKDAKQTYRSVIALISDIAEPNIFSTASGLTAALVTGDRGKQAYFLKLLQTFKPSIEEARSIIGGFDKLSRLMKIDDPIMAEIRATLDGAA